VSSVGWVIKNRVSVSVRVRYGGADVRDGDFGGLFSGWKNVLHSCSLLIQPLSARYSCQAVLF